MSLVIQPTNTIRLSATFLDYNPLTGQEMPVAADSVSVYVYKYNSGNELYELLNMSSPTSIGNGTFFYDWTPGSVGKFKVIFEAVVQIDNTVSDERIFYVGDLDPAVTLGADKTYFFLGELHPLYISPEEILSYYPDGDVVEITQYIYWFSKELESITGISGITELTPLMHDFLLASVLCRLSRIYTFAGGLSGFSKAASFSLGELQVSNETSQSTGGKNSEDLGGAATWCELASLIRVRLTRGAAGNVPYVRGSNHLDRNNPIPSRGLRRFE